MTEPDQLPPDLQEKLDALTGPESPLVQQWAKGPKDMNQADDGAPPDKPERLAYYDPATGIDREGPPLDGTGGVNFDDERGHWVRRMENTPPHQCMPPSRCDSGGRVMGAAKPGELWRCNCGRLWECYVRVPNPHRGEAGGTRVREWRRAGLWLAFRYAEWWGRLPGYQWAGLGLGLAVSVLMLVLGLLGVFP